MPMLDEDEFGQFLDVMGDSRRGMRERAVDGLALYERLTGFKENNINAVWHHRLLIHGPDCATCSKPLRTPRATMCAACGAPRSP
jgi:hypothetical protein